MSDDYLVQVSANRLHEMEAAIDDDTYDAIDKITSLQAEIRKKDAYIGRLETAYVEMVFSATGSDEDAKEALEKVRTG